METGEKRTSLINKYTYYLTDLHSSQKSKSVKYKDLVKTYQVTFFTQSIFPQKKAYVSRYALRTPEGELLTDQINMIFIELDKLNAIISKPIGELTAFEKWSLFLKYAQDPMQREKINAIIKEKEEINMAAALLQEISQDERERARLRSRRMYETDMYSDYHTAMDEALEAAELRLNSKWQGIITEKEAENERLRLRIAELEAKN